MREGFSKDLRRTCWPYSEQLFTPCVNKNIYTAEFGNYLYQTVGGITVMYHFRKTYLMPVIICKNDKHLVTLYNVRFSNMTGILSHLRYIFY